MHTRTVLIAVAPAGMTADIRVLSLVEWRMRRFTCRYRAVTGRAAAPSGHLGMAFLEVQIESPRSPGR